MSYTIQDEREYISGEAHFFKGELYRLKVIRDKTCTHHVEIRGDYIIIYVSEHTSKEKYSQCFMDLVQRTINTNNRTACCKMGANSWGESNNLDYSTNAIQLGQVSKKVAKSCSTSSWQRNH